MKDIRMTRPSLIGLFLILFSIPLFCVGFAISDTTLTLAVIFVVWTGLVVYFFKRENVMILAFLLTFFMFLLGELFINQFDDTAFHASSVQSIRHAHICIYISLMGLFVGTLLNKYRFVSHNSVPLFDKSEIDSDSINEPSTNCLAIRKSCKILYYIFGLCSLIVSFERLFLSLSLGSYTATFIDYTSSLPGIISKFAGMADMVFFMYLATLPDPRKSKLIIGLKLAISIVLLVYGTRSTIVMSIIILTIYIIYYENLSNEKYRIIPKWIYISACVGIPFLLVFFDFMMSYRDGLSYSFNGLTNSVKHIVASIGGSVNVITYGYESEGVLPDKFYSMSGIIDFFTQNIFARTLFGVKQYGGNTVEMALYGNSFSNALTYIIKPSAYLRGYGMGSSFIAEVYHDFGYVGVGIISIIYGDILSKIKNFKRDHFVRNAVMLMASNYILVAPRAYADGFISCFLNFSFLLAVFMVYVLSRFVALGSRNN